MAKQIVIKHRKTGKCLVKNITQTAETIGMSRGALSKKINNSTETDVATNTFYHGNWEVSLQVEADKVPWHL